MSDIPNANRYRSRNVSRPGPGPENRRGTPGSHQPMHARDRGRQSRGIGWGSRALWILAAGLMLVILLFKH